jgi:hypothetical protein
MSSPGSLEQYRGAGALNERQNDSTKAHTKLIQKINHPPIVEFWIIVEGNDDVIFFSPVFNERISKIVPLWGKDNVKHIFCQKSLKKTQKVREFFENAENRNLVNKITRLKGEKKIIGIIDLDFNKELNVNNRYTPAHCRDLFVTETNDAQILLLSNYGLTIFIRKLCDENKVKQFKEQHKIRHLYDQIVIMTNYSGLARYVNKTLSKKIAGYRSLTFKALSPEDIFNEYISETRLLVAKDILDILFTGNLNFFNIDFEEEYGKKVSDIQTYFPNRWDVCQGHDSMRVLLSIQRLVGWDNSKKSEEQLLEEISEIFHSRKYAFFKRTTLFSALKLWERENFPFTTDMFSETYSTKKDKMLH